MGFELCHFWNQVYLSGFQPQTKLTLVTRDSGDKTNYRHVFGAKRTTGGWRPAVTGGHYHLWEESLSLESMESCEYGGNSRWAETVRDQGGMQWARKEKSSDFSHLPSCDLPLLPSGLTQVEARWQGDLVESQKKSHHIWKMTDLFLDRKYILKIKSGIIGNSLYLIK